MKLATWQAAQSGRACFSLSASLSLTIFPFPLSFPSRCSSLCLFSMPLSFLSLHFLTVPFHCSTCCLPFLPFFQSFLPSPTSLLPPLPLSPTLFVYCSFCCSTKTLLFPPAVTISGHFGSARKSLGPAPLGLISICLQER